MNLVFQESTVYGRLLDGPFLTDSARAETYTCNTEHVCAYSELKIGLLSLFVCLLADSISKVPHCRFK